MRVFLTALLLTTVSSAWATRSAEVDVVVDMTPAGKRLKHPDVAHPAFYLPIVGGWSEKGASVHGDKPPSVHDVVHVAALELANQGYHVINAEHRTPDIVLLLFWGSLRPEIDDPGQPTGTFENPFYNQNEMLKLVGGTKLWNLDLPSEREQVMSAAEDDRYFMILAAYDFAQYQATHQRVLLWEARMSVPTNGVTFDDITGTLLKAGGPFLGRDMMRPKILSVPITPEGKVTIGTPKVIDYRDGPLPRPTAVPAK